MKKKTLLIALTAVILLAALGAGGYLYLNRGKTSVRQKTSAGKIGDAAEKLTADAAKGVLPAIGANPLESKPDVNPVDRSNPFNNIKINPFR